MIPRLAGEVVGFYGASPAWWAGSSPARGIGGSARATATATGDGWLRRKESTYPSQTGASFPAGPGRRPPWGEGGHGFWFGVRAQGSPKESSSVSLHGCGKER